MRGPRVWGALAGNLTLALSMGIAAVVAARSLGPDAYGQYTLAIALAGLVTIFAGLGTGVSLRVTSRDKGTQVWLPYLALSTALALLAGLILVVTGAVLFRDLRTAALVGLAGFAMLLGRQGLDGLHAAGRTESALATATASALLLTLTMLALSRAELLNASTAILSAALWATPPAFLFVGVAVATLRAVPTGSRSSGIKSTASALVRMGVPTLGFYVGLVVLQRADRLLLGWYAGPSAVGVYSAAAGISEIARLPPNALGQVAFFRAPESTKSHVQSLRQAGFGGSLMTGSVIFLFAPQIVGLLFGDEYSEAVLPLRILTIAEAAYALAFIDSRTLMAQGRGAIVGRVGVIASMAGILLYLLLIPTAGAAGAALASVLAYVTLSGMLALQYRRNDQVTPKAS